jgi:NADH-quinone oxidoreductase subunit H
MVDALSPMLGPWLAAFAVGLAGIAGLVTVNALFMVWAERKISGWIQGRHGPTERGPMGVFQTLLDVVKLLGKESIVPSQVDRPTYRIAPIVAFLPALALLSLLPYSETWILTDARSGLLLVFAFGGVSLLGIFMGGWASNNKYALLGAMRAVSQNIAYELPLLLSTMSVVILVGSLNLGEIVGAQSGWRWFVLFQPVAFVIFMIAATAETNRAPFDIPEAESELVAGFHTEYGSMSFALFFLAEYTYMFVVCGIAATLFLGGSHGPLLAGPHWFLIKIYGLMFCMVMARWTFPRLRFDQLMNLAWKWLIPLSLINLLITALVVKVVTS